MNIYKALNKRGYRFDRKLNKWIDTRIEKFKEASDYTDEELLNWPKRSCDNWTARWVKKELIKRGYIFNTGFHKWIKE